MTRKSTGKRLRFAVFQRDLFTCQYCGAQPPSAVLVVDHIEPVSAGGETSIDNLITACEACNQGKADKRLTERAVRPDADLLYLETQQEIAELRRYQRALAEREELLNQIVSDLQDLWMDCSGLDWCPSDHLMRRVFAWSEPDIVEASIRIVAPKVGDRVIGNAAGRWMPYMRGVIKNLEEQWQESEGE
jgi:hypothetical protein